MAHGRKGFTLIELLVVIAIIAILAAMLFPVFARARESARKIQCLSNVKNIAIAYQMYLTDYDRFPPSLHDQRVSDWMGSDCWMVKNLGTEPDPYLRIPVILDEYVKNRDVWFCPSGPDGVNFGINWCIPDWFTYAYNQGLWCSRTLCMNPFPPGWGGDVTDTLLQGRCAGGAVTGSFRLNYATVRTNRDLKTSAMGDPTKWVVLGDCSGNIERWHTYSFAYEGCRIACQGQDCGICNLDCWDGYAYTPGMTAYRTDPNARKTTEGVKARHLGGNNLGFADGHAAWMDSEAILWGGRVPVGTEVEGDGPYMPAGDKFENLLNCRFPPVSLVP
jgi:prepilin-type N-terminal cleavage/methylation domain-containing protein/prepilin-type processing-associated H-X9-DG protein